MIVTVASVVDKVTVSVQASVSIVSNINTLTIAAVDYLLDESDNYLLTEAGDRITL